LSLQNQSSQNSKIFTYYLLPITQHLFDYPELKLVTQFMQSSKAAKIILILILSILIIVGAIPGYLQGGKWTWLEPPGITNLGEIKSILNTGLSLPDWQILQQKKVRIGGKNWSVQVMQPENKTVKPLMLMLSPQNYYLDRPSVEWMDLNGLEKWKTDSYQELNLTINENDEIKARFFRGWNPRQTFAVVQWYVFRRGGNAHNSNWFWRDLMAQIHRTREPWIAVCLKIPIQPLGELETILPLAKSLTQQVQINLEKKIQK
jgi:cyanoexosortase B-associated protein